MTTLPGFLRRWLSQIEVPVRSYPKPDRVLRPRELAVVCCYFNPQRSAQRLKNYREFYTRFNAFPTKLRLLTIELAFGDALFELGEFAGVHQIRASDLMWQKERLLKIGIEKLIGDGYEKIAWLDADVSMADPYWAERAAEVLDHYPLCQLFSESVRAEDAGHRLAARRGVAAHFRRSGKIHLRGLSCGYAWAARADLLQRVPLYDAAILGSGDAAIWLGAFSHPDPLRWRKSLRWIRFFRDLGPGLREHYLGWANSFGAAVGSQVGYVEQTIHSFSHGKLKNRFYGRRYRRIPDFDPAQDLRLDSSGCWSWAKRSPEMIEEVRRYFEVRERE